jgi:hypothetical protein
MAGPVRSHRRANPVITALFLGGFAMGLLLVIIVFRVGLAALGEQVGLAGVLVFVGVCLTGAAIRARFHSLRDRRAARELAHWEQTAGWEPTAWRWPWQPLVRWPDTVTVLRAYQKKVDGSPVRTGELTFEDNGLGRAIDRRAGRAAFAIVTLPRPGPSRAVRVFRDVPPRRPQEDPFEHRFQPVGLDQVGPELRAAHVNGEIPPWTAVGDELFVFLPLDGPLRPADLEEAARSAIRVVSRLDR